MAKMIRSKYGYEPPEWVQADARLDKWYKDKKRRAKQHGAFSLEKSVNKKPFKRTVKQAHISSPALFDCTQD
ncbi:hypothetical protein JH395_04985 [Lactiplantibacillus plantarum]|uniref:Uncharacterized protein n=1 Tax=Lactiplantibacillus plantarum TaxID=1590 RepID=A0AAX1KDP3_LACPN|nr:hypothetical protein [Lactiplantibacillus plantarum]KON41202.1 hypothetical protein ADS73_00790 [Lactiplantibacillus plantarum]MBS0940091.1 hypothetical protein [Lactiplantibacillus plantarum]MBW1621520.1 hypothetical protein [Lactiplantibacillus plantarum]MCB7465841.1 hypothetical protein [Lactiplantibacillus plantarum]MCB7469831.1 hypothetical protein [Lactiplantibacillus plantarum]